jgi:hypothetical protein
VHIGSEVGRLVHYLEITVPSWALPDRTVVSVVTRFVEPQQARTPRVLDGIVHARPGAE